jgi:endoglucanase
MLVALVIAPAAVASKLHDAIRVGGPSSVDESKVAIVGSGRDLDGQPFSVVDASGATVLKGQLTKASGKPAPWRHAYDADFTSVTTPGAYRLVVGKLRSKPWQVTAAGSDGAIAAILGFFEANRDGDEPSPVHGPSHLNDATIYPSAPTHPGEHATITGGWMDAGDMIHFTQTTAFATALLEGSARLDPENAAALESEADVGVRWLLAAHPFGDVFVAQVGDERDHEIGFRDPAKDDGSQLPGIGTRFAYTFKPGQIGGDLGGKSAAALAMAYQRTGDPAQLQVAREWYAAGSLSAAPAPSLVKAGYPDFAANFYRATHWEDSMATGALELYRATGEQSYLDDFGRYVASRQSRADGTIGAVDSFAQLGAADACGALGLPALDPGAALDRSCELLRSDGEIVVDQAGSNAFGMPGFFNWGTTAQNGASGALAALASALPDGPAAAKGCEVAAGARDYMLGRNPFGRSFVVGYGPKAPRHPHHWASVFGKGLPKGAVVGGPAPLSQVHGQGFHTSSPFDSRFATYEDERRDYVTSEPALDYAASSILLVAALRAHC